MEPVPPLVILVYWFSASTEVEQSASRGITYRPCELL